MVLRKYDAYVINLDSAPDRWDHMQAEFKDTVLNLIRFPAIKHKVGTIGLFMTFIKIIKAHLTLDPELTGPPLIVLEDDNYRLQTVEVFNERCIKIFDYLEKHRGEYSHFNGSPAFPDGFSLESKEPLLLRVNRSMYTNFIVFGLAAAKSVLKWDSTDKSLPIPINEYISREGAGNIIVPYPHLTWQLFGTQSQIGDNAYTRVTNNAYRDAQKKMVDFIKTQDLNFAAIIGGGRRRVRRSRRRHTRKKRTQK